MSNDLLSYLPSKATQDEIKTNVDSVKTDVASVKTDVSTVNTNVTSVKNDVATVKTNVGTVNTNVDNVKSTVNSINTTVGTINTNLNTVDSIVDSIKSKVDAIDSRTVANNTASATGTLSQKLSHIINQTTSIQASSSLPYVFDRNGSGVITNVISSETLVLSGAGTYNHGKYYLSNGHGTIYIAISAKTNNSSYKISIIYTLYKVDGSVATGYPITSWAPGTSYKTNATSGSPITLQKGDIITFSIETSNASAQVYVNLLSICGDVYTVDEII